MRGLEGFEQGEDYFEREQLFGKVAAHRGLEIVVDRKDPFTDATALKRYDLDDALAAFLAERGFHQVPVQHSSWDFRLTYEGDGSSGVWEGDRLARGMPDPGLALVLGFGMNEAGTGVVLSPKVRSAGQTPGDRDAHASLFRALVAYDKDSPALAREIVENGGRITVAWTEIGLGGLCSLSQLFLRFAGENEAVKMVKNAGVFHPHPRDPASDFRGDIFLTESAQSRIMAGWRSELRSFSERLGQALVP